jgi:exonuclease SbcC
MSEDLDLHNAEQIYRSNLQKRDRLFEKSEFIKKEIEEFYAKKDDLFEKFNDLIKQKDEVYANLNLHKLRRDAFNKKVKDQIQSSRKNSRYDNNFEALKKEYEKLELELQTSYHSVLEENKIIEQIRLLSKMLDAIVPEQNIEIPEKMDIEELKKSADEEHKIVLASIEDIKELNKKIDAVKLQIEGINDMLARKKDEFNIIRDKIDKLSLEIKNMRDKIIELKGDANVENYSVKDNQEEIEEKYDDALEILKSKKKIEF